MAVNTVTVTIDGQTHTLTYNSATGKYEKTITAPTITSFNKEGGYYNLTITATDVAGNTATKSGTSEPSLRLVVKEKTKPTITITAPTDGARITTASPTITGQLRDEANGSGVNKNKFVLKIDGVAVDNSKVTFTTVTNGFNFSYQATGLTNGSHTITVDVEDNDGNKATQKSATFTVDTVAPTLSVTNPVDGLVTNQETLTISGITSDVTSNPVTITITVNGVDQGAVTVDGNGNFSKAVTLTSGANAIVVRAMDSAGLETTVTRNVTLDTVAPVIGAITITPNPVDAGATITISVVVTD